MSEIARAVELPLDVLAWRDGCGEVPAEGAMSYREVNTLVARQ